MFVDQTLPPRPAFFPFVVLSLVQKNVLCHSPGELHACLFTWHFQESKTKRDAEIIQRIFSPRFPMQFCGTEKCGLHGFWRSVLCCDGFFFPSVKCQLVSWLRNTPLFSGAELAEGGAAAVPPVLAFPATLLMSGRR